MNNKPFLNHGITKLSASSINQFKQERAYWCLCRLLKNYPPAGIMAERGHAVEHGVAAALFGGKDPSVESRNFMHDKLRPRFENDDNWQREYDAVPQIAKNAADKLSTLGKLSVHGDYDKGLGKLTTTIHGIPIEGYFDFMWGGPGRESTVVVDLKATLRMPFAEKDDEPTRLDKLEGGHVAQQAIYHQCLPVYLQDPKYTFRIGLCYATCTRCEIVWLPEKLLNQKLVEVRSTVASMREFLSLSKDPTRLARSQAPNYDHYFWSSDEARQMGRNFYGY